MTGTTRVTLNEGKALLKDVQQAMVREQVNQYLGAHRHCADCGRPRGHKGAHTSGLADGVWHAAATQSTSLRLRLPNAGARGRWRRCSPREQPRNSYISRTGLQL